MKQKGLLVHFGRSKYRLFPSSFAIAEHYGVDDALENVDNLVILLSCSQCSNRTSCSQNGQCNLGPVK